MQLMLLRHKLWVLLWCHPLLSREILRHLERYWHDTIWLVLRTLLQ